MRLCETFRSIQGELQGIGRQAFFIRMAGCNLGAACTVDCDTRYSWDTTFNSHFYETDISIICNEIDNAKVDAVVITGGEPMLQQSEIILVVRSFPKIDWFIETNGTIAPDPVLSRIGTVYFNVSPKLQKFDPSLFPLERSIFKHVVNPRKEEFNSWIDKMASMPNEIARRVFFMPASKTKEQYIENAPVVAAWCNERGFNFGPREHMVLFGGKRGY